MKSAENVSSVSETKPEPEPEPAPVQKAPVAAGQPEPVKVEPAKYYGIQIMSLGRLLQADDPALKGLEVSAVKPEGGKLYKYVAGKYSSKSEAGSALSKVKALFPGAFVVKVEGDLVFIP